MHVRRGTYLSVKPLVRGCDDPRDGGWLKLVAVVKALFQVDDLHN